MSQPESISPILKQLDNDLFELVKGVDILDAVTPLNYKEQKIAFFNSNFTRNPEFNYGKQNIDTFQRKRALFNLPVESLQDDDIIKLYSDVIESYVDKIDQCKSIGSPDFLYDSMRYYGEPSEKDLRNANFIMHLPDGQQTPADELLPSEKIVTELEAFAQQQGYQYQISLSDSMIANILVSGTTIKVNRGAKISSVEMNALTHHEVGVHLATTLNARQQPLRILSLGCPVNTMTQEGLAILCEYLAGYMDLPRLKVLALRVLAVDSMIKEKDFKTTFSMLVEEHKTSVDTAFTITSRVYRGGGFTKDYLYLQGLHQMLNAYETRADFINLLGGKVSIDYLGIVSNLINKGYLSEPMYISPAIANPVENDAVKQFIAHAIK
ncbi:flavohemoglobin expression-modulating QEGLA motif protein [Halioxenophilus sp. WMMB6]|uniref:flavohemoglobin expression-modulating QEGLA motif protein n=1 Tax=Halioxenophilus sp. WMMB6 TaxID=3073815 RepID=UPI00295E87AC|nr:flavohemoglobin expression-modulating QEGLA motif protein [Halioxenophilus sp. WMMB6]